MEVEGNGSHTLYGGDGPRYNPDGSFNGHAVLVVPPARRFMDATLQQYAEVPDTERGTAPLLAPLPDGVGLGSAWLAIDRGDHRVVYRPVPADQREAWRKPSRQASHDDYRRAGANLAANVFDMLRSEFFRDKSLASPYPRLHRLIKALDEATSIADGHGYRFRPAGAAAEVRLADILSPDGAVLASHSLYDVLTTEPVLAALIETHIDRRRAASPDPDGTVLATLPGGRDASQRLRDLPGAPADVLHANTVEVLSAHPGGLWSDGDVLVSLRNLDLIAVVDLSDREVRWHFGPGQLSGQHQPSALPGGNLLVFDNGAAVGRSRVLEIDPAARRIAWQYTAGPPQHLFCALAGGCEQLPTGNILISDSQAGRALEITRSGEVVWAVQTRMPRTQGASRAELYRMAAVPASTALLLRGANHTNHAARRLADAQLRCTPQH
ncbi:Arylsulfotransferase (ASST) [Sinosporangium album]|uniref:Arylsulfotransferase (ASST) n=1 Tax=Sinosporangium album TaxID=504805 RepID=A0A1G8KI17_9ACTN|nr:Arylsulfotransferase (ASST) [Sinosporangium album]